MPDIDNKTREIVLFQRALRQELANTLKTEAPKIKEESMREMAKMSALDINHWGMANGSSSAADQLLDAYQLVYLTGRFDRLRHYLSSMLGKGAVYNTDAWKYYNAKLRIGVHESNKTSAQYYVVLDKDSEGNIRQVSGNPYVYLQKANIGLLEAIGTYGIPYLFNQKKDNEQKQFELMREDYINQKKNEWADFVADVKRSVSSVTASVQAPFSKLINKLKGYAPLKNEIALDDMGSESDVSSVKSKGSDYKKNDDAKPRAYTAIEQARQDIKTNVLEHEKAADAKLQRTLDALIVGNKMSDENRAEVFTKAFKHTANHAHLAYINIAGGTYATSAQNYVLATNPKSYTEALNALREYFSLRVADRLKAESNNQYFFVKSKNGSSPADDFVKTSNQEYADAVILYHEKLMEIAKINNAPAYLKAQESIKAGDHLEDEIAAEFEAMKANRDLVLTRKRQEYLKNGFTLAKRFAIGCGFFSAGAWALLIAGFAPWWVAGLSLVPCFYFAFHAMRMNWLSSNDEMGDPFFYADVNPGDLRTLNQKAKTMFLALLGFNGLAAFKAEWTAVFTPESEYSVKGARRAAQHFANTTTGVVWGLLTAIGLFSLCYALPTIFYPGLFEWGSAFMMNMGFLGTVNIVAFSVFGALGLVLGIVTYRVFGLLIRDKSDKDLSQGKALYTNYFKELFLVSHINNKVSPTSTHYVKQTATLFGILLTAMSSITLLGDIVSLATGAKFGLQFMGVNGAIAVASLLAFSIIVVAFIGLKDFYIQRSQNSVLKGQADTFGGRLANFDGDKLNNLGIDASAPDFAAQVEKANPKNSGFKVGEYFFSTADGVNSDRSRRVNAISQAGPAISGGVAFMLLTLSAGLVSLGVLLPVANGLGIAIGVIGGICAAVGSYQANGIGNRKVKHNITEEPVLEKEAAVLNTLSLTTKKMESVKNIVNYSPACFVAEAEFEIDNFIKCYERKQAAYHGIQSARTIPNQARLEAAKCLLGEYQKNRTVLAREDLQLATTAASYNGKSYTAAELNDMGRALVEPGSALSKLYVNFATAVDRNNAVHKPVQSPQLA